MKAVRTAEEEPLKLPFFLEDTVPGLTPQSFGSCCPAGTPPDRRDVEIIESCTDLLAFLGFSDINGDQSDHVKALHRVLSAHFAALEGCVARVCVSLIQGPKSYAKSLLDSLCRDKPALPNLSLAQKRHYRAQNSHHDCWLHHGRRARLRGHWRHPRHAVRRQHLA